MKKILTFVLVALLMFSIVVAAPGFPVPISGTASLNGVTLPGQEVSLYNKNTGDELIARTDINGHFIVDFSQRAWYPGSVLGVSLIGCEKPECSIEIVMDGDPIRGLKFPISGQDTGLVQKYVCADKSIVTDSSLCPPVVGGYNY